MKKNTGRIYFLYKENRAFIDASAPVILGIVGMLVGFYVKKKLTEYHLDDAVTSAAMAALTALPVGIYNKLAISYSAKIQEDKDCEELEEKNSQLKTYRRNATKHKKEIERLKKEKVKTYNAHDKLSRDIKRYLNGENIDSSVRFNICELLDNGNGDIFELTLSVDGEAINDDDNNADNNETTTVVYSRTTSASSLPVN